MIDLRPIRSPRMPFLMWLGMWWSFLGSVAVGLVMLGVGLRWLFGAIPSQTLVGSLCFGALGANLWIVWHAFRRRLPWGRLPALLFWVTHWIAYATMGIVSGEPAMLEPWAREAGFPGCPEPSGNHRK